LVELLTVESNFAKFAREEFGKWLQPELVEPVDRRAQQGRVEFPSQNGTPPVKPAVETGT